MGYGVGVLTKTLGVRVTFDLAQEAAGQGLVERRKAIVFSEPRHPAGALEVQAAAQDRSGGEEFGGGGAEVRDARPDHVVYAGGEQVLQGFLFEGCDFKRRAALRRSGDQHAPLHQRTQGLGEEEGLPARLRVEPPAQAI